MPRTILTHGRIVAAAVAVAAATSNAAAEILQTKVVATTTNVFAGIDPLWDPADPPDPMPQPDARFAERFRPGQQLNITYRFDTAATDWYDERITPRADLGIYSAIVAAEIRVDGLTYELSEENISAQLDHPSTGEDLFGIEAYAYETISDPIPADGIALSFVIADRGLFQTDALPSVPPSHWSRSIGRFRLSAGAGLLYEVSFEVDDIYNAPPTGDYNGDGAVNAGDYVIWRKNDGALEGYNAWRAAYGSTTGSGLGANASAAVPEPATLVTFLIAMLPQCRRCRRASAVNS